MNWKCDYLVFFQGSHNISPFQAALSLRLFRGGVPSELEKLNLASSDRMLCCFKTSISLEVLKANGIKILTEDEPCDCFLKPLRMKISCLVLTVTSVSLLFLFSYRGVLKYQTNLEEHPPGCFNPNKTLRENMTVPKAFEELFPDYTTGPFPEDLSVPEPFVQNNFMRICSEEPKFQSHFPEVCMIRRFRYYKPCQVFPSAITTNYCFSRPDVLIMENIIKTFSGIQRFGGEETICIKP